MQFLNWRTAAATALCAVTCSLSSLAQAPPPITLRIEYENGVRYIYDSVDIPAFATVPNPLSQANPTFATYVLLADVVAVNGKPAKGVFLTRQIVVNLTPTPTAGQAIADLARTNVLDRIVEIQQPDGTPIGSITTLGFDGGDLPPGGPFSARLGSFAVTGGTGAFLGVRGQAAGGGMTVANRNASIREDPAKRRVNGGGKASLVLQLIPMSYPEIVSTSGGPAVTHSTDFTLVSASKPAAAGEVLSLFASGLGPVRASVDPGQPFPSNPLAAANSPVELTVNGKPAEVLAAVGYPGTTDRYQVNFRVPPDTPKGTATLQVTVAWIPGPPVNIQIQ
jgi:hypothetical protein